MIKRKPSVILVLTGIGMLGVTACSRPQEEPVRKKETEMVSLDQTNLFGYEEPVTIKAELVQNSDFEWTAGETPESNTWTDLYQENGIQLDIMYIVDDTKQDAKRSAAIASGEYPDIMSVSGSELIQYAKSGVIADISEVYEQYASEDLEEYVSLSEISWLDSAKLNGRLYGIPKVIDTRSEAMMMFIRQDWLDRLGLKIPETMEELKETAYAFTYDDPDGNGVDDTYGLVLNGKEGYSYWSGIQAFFEGYGAAPGHWNGQFSFIEKEGTVMWGGSLAEEMKAALRDLQEMYRAGSLTNRFGIMDYNQIISEVGKGRCGIYFAPRWGAMNPIIEAVKNDPEAHLVTARIPDGMGEGSSRPYIATMPETYYVVSSRCENPEVLIKLANLSVDKLCHYDSEEEYDKYTGKANVYNGWKASLLPLVNQVDSIRDFEIEYEAVRTGDHSNLTTESQRSHVRDMEAYLKAVKDDTLLERLKEGDSEIENGLGMWTVDGDPLGGGLTMMRMMEEDRYNECVYSYAPTDLMSEKYLILEEITVETIIKIIMGADSVESYDVFLESWEKLGGAEITQEAQRLYEKNRENEKMEE